MKKILFLGACVASLAIASSSAFAAVSYGQDDTLKITNPTADTSEVTTISVDASGFGTEGQMTVLVLDGTDSTNITADKILYIDQEAAGTNIFQDMGLKLPEGSTKLADGSYKIMVGNDQGAAIQTAVLTISSGTTGKTINFKWGDVNGKDDVSSADAGYIMAWLTGGPASIDGALYDINEAFTTTDGTTYKWGDVNCKDDVSSADAGYIMAWLTGGPASIDGAPFDINADATFSVPAN